MEIDIGITDKQKEILRDETNSAKRLSNTTNFLFSNVNDALEEMVLAHNTGLDNIDLDKLPDGRFEFTNYEGESKTVGLTDEENYFKFVAKQSDINPNPMFFLGDYDWKTSINTVDGCSLDSINTNNSKYSLKVAGYNKNIRSDTFIPVDPLKMYRGNITLRIDNEYLNDIPGHEVIYYLGVECFDKDFLQIRRYNYSSTVDDQGYVISYDSKNNSMVVLGDISKWRLVFDNYTSYSVPQFLFHKDVDGKHRYVSESGYAYEKLGYSRWLSSITVDTTITDNGDGTFVLNNLSPMEGFTPDETFAIRISHNAYRYTYTQSAYRVPVDNKWYNIKSPWIVKKFDNDPTDINVLFPSGTVYCKMFYICNYKVRYEDEDVSEFKREATIAYTEKIGLEWKHE